MSPRRPTPPQSAMRVAYLVNQYPKVSHTFIRREIAALERQGVQVDRYALRGWDADVQDPEDLQEQARTRYLLQEGVWAVLPMLGAWLGRWFSAPAASWIALKTAWQMGRHADRPRLFHFIYLLEAARLCIWLRQSGAAHLHAHFGTNSAEVAMLAHLLGGPGFSFTVHGPEEFDKPQFLGLATKIEAARFVVAISSFGRSQLWRWLPADAWHKVQVVHCGLDADSFISAESAAPSPSMRLVCVGRLCEQKGQLLLLEAASLVAVDHPTFELVLAGDGEMRTALEQAIAARGLQSKVRITGWIDSSTVRTEILAARGLVLPSFAEGLPVVLMEAMAMARPVISTQIAGIPELVRPGQDGWLVAAGDVQALAQAMRECLASSPERLVAMGRSALAQVTERHHIDQQAALLRSLFTDHADPLMRR